MQYTYHTHSNIGKRARNEDFLLPNAATGVGNHFVLCDGVGGNGNGDLASAFVAQKLYDALANQPTLCRDCIHETLLETSARLREFGHAHGNPNMATTVVFLKTDGAQALVGWVGDSRFYHFRQGAILFKTTDHSLVNWLAQKGGLPGYHTHMRHIIWQSMGQNTPMEPGFAHVNDVQPGDLFLLASDGLTEVWTDDELADVLLLEPAQAVKELVLRCLEQSRDNYTFALIEAHPTKG